MKPQILPRTDAPGALAVRLGSLPNQHRSAAAFTLVEVLVALAIVAMAVVVLGSSYLNILNSYETATRGVQVSEDFAFARQLVLTEPDRTKLEQGGEFDVTGGRRAKWTTEIVSTNLADLFKVTFTCEIADPTRPEPEKIQQTFVLLRPTWSIDPVERSKLKEETKTRILEIQGKLAK
jgi:general secretion pathway protein I